MFFRNLLGFLGKIVVSAAAWLILFVPSLAQATVVECVYPDTYYIFMPSMTVNAGRDVAVGEAVGPWISANASPAWTCRRILELGGEVRIGIAGYAPYVRQGSMTVDGLSFAIYTSAVKEGLGYIVRWRTRYGGQTSNWQALSSAAGVWVEPETMFGPVLYDNNQTRFTLDVEVQVRFVKTSANLTAGYVAAFDPMYLQPYRTLEGGKSFEYGPYRIVDYKLADLTIAAGGTCTTPDVSVLFPSVSVSAFKGVGSRAGITDFSLSFNNCPSGLNSIGYSFAPTTSVADASQGVVKLDVASTAKGIGIQLMNEGSEPVQYGTVYPLKNYDPLITGNYRVPLKASLYQIDPIVAAGKVKGTVTFTMSYK